MLIPLGHQQITSLASAAALTVPAGARFATIRCEAQNVRWCDDGNDPTASVGMLMTTTDEPVLFDTTLSTLKFIETVASAKLNVAYYKQG